jgi:hypothetical protein
MNGSNRIKKRGQVHLLIGPVPFICPCPLYMPLYPPPFARYPGACRTERARSNTPMSPP